MIRLSQLGPTSFPADHIVAIDGQAMVTWKEFCGQIGGAMQLIAPESLLALTVSNSCRFLASLIAAGARSAHIIIPSNPLGSSVPESDYKPDFVLDDSFPVQSAEHSFDLANKPLSIDFYTSGSSGNAKRIRRNLWQMEAEVATLETVWKDQTGQAVTFSTIPHQHVYGLIFRLLWPLLSGRPFIINRYDFWEDLLRELTPGAVLVTGPSHLGRMGGLEKLPAARSPVLVLSAGAPLPNEAAKEAFGILGRPIDEIYGSTETGAIATRQRIEPDPYWWALPEYDLAGSPDGLLRMTAPSIISGTGIELQDFVIFQKDGSFVLKGRADRIAKIEGKRIDLDHVEAALLAMSIIKDAVVLTLEGPKPVLAAVVVLTPDAVARLSTDGQFRFVRELRKNLSVADEPSAIPKRWLFVESLAGNAMSKRTSEARKLLQEAGHDQ